MSYKTIEDVRAELERLVGDIDPASARGKTRRRILDAASERFVVHGYRKTNIDEIARQAGIGKGTVYLHFATKTEVLVAALAREKLRAFEVMRLALAADATPRQRLRACVKATLLMVGDSPLIARVVAGDQELTAILADLDPAMKETALSDRDAFFGRMLDEAIAPAVWSEAARRERLVVIEALAHLAPRVNDPQIHRGLGLERFAEVLADLIVEGVRPA